MPRVAGGQVRSRRGGLSARSFGLPPQAVSPGLVWATKGDTRPVPRPPTDCSRRRPAIRYRHCDGPQYRQRPRAEMPVMRYSPTVSSSLGPRYIAHRRRSRADHPVAWRPESGATRRTQVETQPYRDPRVTGRACGRQREPQLGWLDRGAGLSASG
jgi:hypothetical protein